MSNNQTATFEFSNYHRPQTVKTMKFASVNPQLDSAKIRLGIQKLNVDDAKKPNTSLNGFNFNGLEPGVKANKSQKQDYNNLRRYYSSFEATKNKTKQVFPNEDAYQLNESVVPTGNNFVSTTPTLIDNRSMSVNVPNVESYKAADGTIYRNFNDNGMVTKEANYPTKNVIHVPGKYHELYRQWASSTEIPQNIRHRFGTYETERLLADEIKVHDTLSKIHNSGIIKKNVKEEENELKLTKNEKDLLINEYYDLGNHLRHAIAHGLPTVYKTGHKEEVHSAEVNRQHLENWKKNVITPHRRKTDWLSQWLELSITDNKMIKDFKEFREEQANRLPMIRVPREKSEKPKAGKEKKKPKTEQQEGFEPVIFEEPVEEAKPQENAEGGNEFWEYYDKNT